MTKLITVILAALVLLPACSDSEVADITCNEGAYRCEGDSLERCEESVWTFYRDCTESGKVCIENECQTEDGDYTDGDGTTDGDTTDGDANGNGGCTSNEDCRSSEVCMGWSTGNGVCEVQCLPEEEWFIPESCTIGGLNDGFVNTIRYGSGTAIPCETNNDCVGIWKCDPCSYGANTDYICPGTGTNRRCFRVDPSN